MPNGTFIIDGIEKALTIDWINNRSLKNSPIDRSLDILKSTAIKRMSRISSESIIPSKLIDKGPFEMAIAEFFSNSRKP
jgi:DNA-directed RNA polymerase beta subunit